MSSAASNPRLRLVGVGDPSDHEAWAERRAARQAVIRENRAAARNPSLDPTDPRWVLAARAYALLEGSVMTPERRERVMRTARRLGVRPFDASIIIAIVQDHARRGEDLGHAEPTLALISKPQRSARRDWVRWGAALVTAAGMTALMAWWVMGGA